MTSEKFVPPSEEEPFILSLQKIPELIRVGLGDGNFLNLPVIPTQLRLEVLTKDTPPEDMESLLSKIQAFIRLTYQVEITITQAWDLIGVVRTAFELHKKKLVDTLTLLSGSELTPSPLPVQKE